MKKINFKFVYWTITAIIWGFISYNIYNIIYVSGYTDGYITGSDNMTKFAIELIDSSYVDIYGAGYLSGYTDCSKYVSEQIDSAIAQLKADTLVIIGKEKTPDSYEFISRQGKLYSRLITHLPNSTGIRL